MSCCNPLLWEQEWTWSAPPQQVRQRAEQEDCCQLQAEADCCRLETNHLPVLIHLLVEEVGQQTQHLGAAHQLKAEKAAATGRVGTQLKEPNPFEHLICKVLLLSPHHSST